jgi:hypothetical protein
VLCIQKRFEISPPKQAVLALAMAHGDITQRKAMGHMKEREIREIHVKVRNLRKKNL